MADQARRVAIPREMLRDLYMPRRSKAALAVGRCPACSKVLDVIDTWERALPDHACGYTFNYYEWPWTTVQLPPYKPREASE